MSAHEQKARPGDKVDFDHYVAEYEAIINSQAKWAGGSLDHFIGVRLGLVAELTRFDAARSEGTVVLDFGCGIGATEIQMRSRFGAAQIVGVDVSEASIAAARQRGLQGVTFETIKPNAPLPLADGSVDIVYSNGTFHHIPHEDHAFIFSEMHRVLKPGGKVFIFENNFFNPVTLFAMSRNPFDADACTIAPPKMRRRISAAGFFDVKQGYYCFFLKPLTFLRFAERYLRWLPFGAQYFTWGIKR